MLGREDGEEHVQGGDGEAQSDQRRNGKQLERRLVFEGWFAAPAVCAARKGGGAGESDSGDEGRHDRTRRRCARQPVPAGFDQLLVGFGEDLLWRLAVLVRP